MKKSPFCAEEIQDTAVFCKHCRSNLAATASAAPGSATPTSPSAALGGLLVFAGLFLLFMGFSEYYGGATTQDLYKGTVLEHNADTNRIMDNAMSGGRMKIGIGVVLLLFGSVVAARGKAAGAPSGTVLPPPQEPVNQSFRLTASAKKGQFSWRGLTTAERIIAGIAIIAIGFMVLFWIVVLLGSK